MIFEQSRDSPARSHGSRLSMSEEPPPPHPPNSKYKNIRIYIYSTLISVVERKDDTCVERAGVRREMSTLSVSSPDSDLLQALIMADVFTCQTMKSTGLINVGSKWMKVRRFQGVLLLKLSHWTGCWFIRDQDYKLLGLSDSFSFFLCFNTVIKYIH